jgi:signal-transduction protein with cAMP-binding, CBS, and nucleotidyltransferase domain
MMTLDTLGFRTVPDDRIGDVSEFAARHPSALTPYSPVGDLVRLGTVTVETDATLQEAARRMRVADVSSALVGDGSAIITERDITAAMAAGCAPSTPVGAVAGSDPRTLSADESVLAAAIEMLQHRIRHLVLVQGDAVVGVVSLRPILGILVRAMDPTVWALINHTMFERTEIWIG